VRVITEEYKKMKWRDFETCLDQSVKDIAWNTTNRKGVNKTYTFVEVLCKLHSPKEIVDLLSFTPAKFDPAQYIYCSPFWRLLKRGFYYVFKVAMASAKRIHGDEFDCFNIRGDPLEVRCAKLGNRFIPALEFLLEQGAE
jgi:hypothetical protein